MAEEFMYTGQSKSPAAAPTQGSEREKVLMQAAALTCGERNDSYGGPALNMDCFAALLDVYRSFAARAPGDRPSPAHDAAITMVLAKVARIAIGARGHRDNYIDGAAYLAIAYEVDNV
jgi:hypothetical protein